MPKAPDLYALCGQSLTAHQSRSLLNAVTNHNGELALVIAAAFQAGIEAGRAQAETDAARSRL